MPVIHPERGNAAAEHHERHEGKHDGVRRQLRSEAAPDGVLLLVDPALCRAVPLVVRRAPSIEHTFRHSLFDVRSRGSERSAARFDRVRIFRAKLPARIFPSLLLLLPKQWKTTYHCSFLSISLTQRLIFTYRSAKKDRLAVSGQAS